MANTREIKNRIESVQQTRKITNAMYLIASTKLRKARNDLANTGRILTRCGARSSGSFAQQGM